MNHKRWIKLAWLWGAVAAGVMVACGNEPAPTATQAPNPTPTQAAATLPIATPAATEASLTIAPSPTPAPTATPAATPTPTTAPTPDPALAALGLEVTSPEDNSVAHDQNVTVAGVTAPDAVVSVNGQLVTPDASGAFTATVTITEDQNPMSIEIVASDFTGAEASVIRSVIYIP